MRVVLLVGLMACNPAVDGDNRDKVPPGKDDTGEPSQDDTGQPSDDTGTVAVGEVKATVHSTMPSIILLSWTQDGAASVQAEYSVDDGVWLETPTWEVDAGAREIPLLGIPFSTEVTWRLLVDGTAVTDDAVIETGSAPGDVPDVDDFDGDEDSWDPDTRYILGSIQASGGGGETWSFIVDRHGRAVWANETPSGRATFSPMPSYDGTEILIDYNSWWGSFDGGVNSQVDRLDIEGSSLGRYDTPGLIHPFSQDWEGTIIWTAAQGGTGYSGEVLAYLDEDGEPQDLFDCNAFSRARGGDQCGANAVWRDPSTGNYLMSVYTLDTVIEVDAGGEAVRWFGQLRDSWEFADPDTTFWWQHGAHYLDDGHLLVSTRRTETAEETVVREYELDGDNEELVEVWSAGEGLGVYASILGEARRLPNGNTLHNFGDNPRLREYTPDGDVVWDIRWDESGTLGCTHPVDDLYAMWHGEP